MSICDTDRLRTWARSQVFANGRFAEVDGATGEVLSEHRHPRFIRDGDYDRQDVLDWDDYGRPERAGDVPQQPALNLEWHERTGWLSNGKRLYTMRERRETLRLYHDELMQPAKIAALTGIPRETIRSWIRRQPQAA